VVFFFVRTVVCPEVLDNVTCFVADSAFVAIFVLVPDVLFILLRSVLQNYVLLLV